MVKNIWEWGRPRGVSAFLRLEITDLGSRIIFGAIGMGIMEAYCPRDLLHNGERYGPRSPMHHDMEGRYGCMSTDQQSEICCVT